MLSLIRAASYFEGGRPCRTTLSPYSPLLWDYSPAEIEDLDRDCTLLHCEAVRLAHGKLAGEQLKLIHVEIDRMEQASETGNDQEAFRLHSDMHLRIYQASGWMCWLGFLGVFGTRASGTGTPCATIAISRPGLRNTVSWSSSWSEGHRKRRSWKCGHTWLEHAMRSWRLSQ